MVILYKYSASCKINVLYLSCIQLHACSAASYVYSSYDSATGQRIRITPLIILSCQCIVCSFMIMQITDSRTGRCSMQLQAMH